MRLSSPLSVPALLAIGFAAVVLGGCDSAIDPDQARLCRTVIPALNPDAQQIVVENAGPGHRPHSLRIGYLVTEKTGAARNRAVICLFAAGGPDPRKAELVGVATEEGPLSEAAFYFLRRFWLEDRQSPPLDPGPPPRTELPAAQPHAAADSVTGRLHRTMRDAIVATP